MMKAARAEIDFAQTLTPVAYIASTNGIGVSKIGYYGILATLAIGTVTDGTHVFKLQDSDDNVSFTDVAANKMQGSFASVSSANSNSVQRVAYLGLKKYVRVIVTVTSATVGGVYSANIIRAFPGAKPLP